MKKLIRVMYSGVLLVLYGAMPTTAMADFEAQPLPAEYIESAPFSYTGMLLFEAGFHCSGAVVKDPRLVMSAAHCIYDPDNADDPWGAPPEWFLRRHNPKLPTAGTGQPTRGYVLFSSYAPIVDDQGRNSRTAFDHDLLVNLSYEGMAESAAPLAENGLEYLTTPQWKMIVGYPSDAYLSDPNNPERYLMHFTGPYQDECEVEENSYVTCLGVSVGGGNSGGPVFGWDGEQFLYTGTYVSGLETKTDGPINLAGINTFAEDELNLFEGAIQAADQLPPDDPDEILTEEEPMIELLGNRRTIRSGDASPSKADQTDFGTTSRSRTVTRRFYIRNDGDAPLALTGTRPIKMHGAGARYYRVSGPTTRSVGPRSSTSFTVTFLRSPRGRYSSVVSIASNQPDTPLYKFKVQALRR